MTFSDFVRFPIDYLLNPGHRIFILYWFIAALIAAIVILPSKKWSLSLTVKSILDTRVWRHRSSRLDFQLMALNIFLKFVMWTILAFSSLEIAKWTVRVLTQSFGYQQFLMGQSVLIIALYTLCNFIALDLVRFLHHYAFHKIPVLWEFHKVHHSAAVLNPISLYRTHPIESLSASLLRAVVIGVVAGIFIFLSKGRIDIFTILGVNAIDFLFNFAGSNLRHSHVWMSFGPLDRFFVSPAHHQIHHSRAVRHHDKNLGFSLSVWDQLFGTFHPATKKEFLIFGVYGEKNHGLNHNLVSPFQSIFQKSGINAEGKPSSGKTKQSIINTFSGNNPMAFKFTQNLLKFLQRFAFKPN